ncbi:MAG: ERCC4 domain-containing protein [Desulfovibrio sp.]|nr:ERCC4 domain-containing protein [Desulfovibrio sp.]
MRIVADTREQMPYKFELPVYDGTTLERGTLPTGDYSLAGLEAQVAVERKSLPDLMACMGRERKRFMAEMERARGYRAFAVIAECSWKDIASHAYKAQVKPQAALATLTAIMARYGVPVIFTGSRAAGEYACWCFLRQFAKGKAQEAKAVLAAVAE